MELTKYLLDTNVVINFLGNKFKESESILFINSVIDVVPNISIITKVEVLGYPPKEGEYEMLEGFINDSIILPLSDGVVEKTIEIRRNFKRKIPDAIIAATAIVHEMVLITNDKDFEKILELKIRRP